MAGIKIKELFAIDKNPKRSLLALEWAVLIYTAFTFILMAVMYTNLHNTEQMIMLRVRVLVLVFAMWGVYRLVPCPLMMFVRVGIQMAMLGDWYPDTYEFNRCFLNLDHVFAGIEHSIFGMQPSLVFSRLMPWGVVSEPLDMGYFSYYPIIAFTALFYFFYRRPQFTKTVFIILASFFMFYVIFIFVPVAGPTFYFKAIGVDVIEQGVFPAVGHYFEHHHDLATDCLPSPGWTGGLFWNLVEMAKWAGERPTAAFPSSHVGITTVCMFLLWFSGNRKVFLWVLPLAVLMFFATFYIQAHYLIDALAGLVFGSVFYFAFDYSYDYFNRR